MRKIATLAALALVAAACGSSDSEPAATTTTTTTMATTTTTTAATTTTTEPAPTVSYPEFTEGDFYAPASLPSGEHGDVIWADEIEAPTGAKAWRVLYLSESVNGEPIGVSGFVMTPDSEPPPGGWPTISWAHGTTGVADVCAPTASPTLTEDLGNFFAIAGGFGFAMVATDYEGLGTPGVHTWMVGDSAGRSVIDMMRAGLQIEEAGLGNRYVAWGHSQGAQAALREAYSVRHGVPAPAQERSVPLVPREGTGEVGHNGQAGRNVRLHAGYPQPQANGGESE